MASASRRSDSRDLTNRIQGTSGYRDGTALETLRAIAKQYGLQTAGPDDSRPYGRWTTSDVRRQVSKGWPVITLVRYRSLPWNSASSSQSLHYIVVVGTTSRGFFVHDVGAAGRGVGRYRVLSSAGLEKAWADSGLLWARPRFRTPARRALAADRSASRLGVPRPRGDRLRRQSDGGRGATRHRGSPASRACLVHELGGGSPPAARTRSSPARSRGTDADTAGLPVVDRAARSGRQKPFAALQQRGHGELDTAGSRALGSLVTLVEHGRRGADVRRANSAERHRDGPGCRA